MKNIMKSLSLIFTFLLVANILTAQPGRGGQRGGTPEERAEKQTERMTEQLALSEAQTEKIGAVNLDYAKKFSEARKNADGDWEAMRETMGALRAAQTEEFKKYLTEEQFTKLEKMQAERGGRRGGPGMRKGKKRPVEKPQLEKDGEGSN